MADLTDGGGACYAPAARATCCAPEEWAACCEGARGGACGCAQGDGVRVAAGPPVRGPEPGRED